MSVTRAAAELGVSPSAVSQQKVGPLCPDLFQCRANSSAVLKVDLVNRKITGEEIDLSFTLGEARRGTLLEGLSETDLILSYEKDLDDFERQDRIERP